MTTLSDQNGLRQLVAKIKGLPVQTESLRRRQIFQGVQNNARQRRTELQTTMEQLKALRTIEGKPDLLADPEQNRFATVAARAREMLVLVGKTDLESSKFSEKLEAIKRTTKALSDDVETKWAQVCKEYQERANVLRPLAERLSPSLVQRIQDLDRLLRPGTKNPPTSDETVRSILAARKALASDIASLDIDGPVETFLRDTQTGNGDPKALLDPQVRDYLDAHPTLWKSLRVVFG
jgi:prefoldin subunit 5